MTTQNYFRKERFYNWFSGAEEAIEDQIAKKAAIMWFNLLL
jgi:hypothetical protein